MAKKYEIINRTNECEILIFSFDLVHKFTINKEYGYTKKFYEKLFNDIENYKSGLNYDDFSNDKLKNESIITCHNGELYFMNSSSFTGIKSETKVSNKISRDILVELLGYL